MTEGRKALRCSTGCYNFSSHNGCWDIKSVHFVLHVLLNSSFESRWRGYFYSRLTQDLRPFAHRSDTVSQNEWQSYVRFTDTDEVVWRRHLGHATSPNNRAGKVPRHPLPRAWQCRRAKSHLPPHLLHACPRRSMTDQVITMPLLPVNLVIEGSKSSGHKYNMLCLLTSSTTPFQSTA